MVFVNTMTKRNMACRQTGESVLSVNANEIGDDCFENAEKNGDDETAHRTQLPSSSPKRRWREYYY